jgi:hypothetical protein
LKESATVTVTTDNTIIRALNLGVTVPLWFLLIYRQYLAFKLDQS